MNRRFVLRKEELLADCEVGPEAFTGIGGGGGAIKVP